MPQILALCLQLVNGELSFICNPHQHAAKAVLRKASMSSSQERLRENIADWRGVGPKAAREASCSEAIVLVMAYFGTWEQWIVKTEKQVILEIRMPIKKHIGQAAIDGQQKGADTLAELGSDLVRVLNDKLSMT
jgi:hypothetical protein